MPRPPIDYLNARQAHMPASGGRNYAKHDRAVNAAVERARLAQLDVLARVQRQALRPVANLDRPRRRGALPPAPRARTRLVPGDESDAIAQVVDPIAGPSCTQIVRRKTWRDLSPAETSVLLA
jgi:hypothetical protein